MALDNPTLRNVLEDVASGATQLPDFQREWKWDDERIRALLATVTMNYPLGVVMTLETGGQSPFKARPLVGAPDAEGREPSLLLLDGQQRLTSLFQALHHDQPVKTVDARKRKVECWYYIDIEKAIGSPSDRDDAIVSVPQDKILKRDFGRKVALDLSTVENECRAKYFPLNIAYDTGKVTAWHQQFVAESHENWPLWAAFQQHVLNHVNAYQIPMIRLPASTTMDAVCAVFERVNTGGVPLDVFELLTATYAGDRGYVATHGTYYELPKVWRDIKSELAVSYPVFGNAGGGEGGLTSSDFLQAVSLVRTWELKSKREGAAVSCKRRDLLGLPLEDFRRLAPVVAEAFAWVGAFLERQFIVHPADLPYRTQLVPLAAVRAIVGNETDEPWKEDRISRWYWCGVLGELYSGSLESRFPRDVEQLIAWMGEEGAAQPDSVLEAAFLEDRLDTLTTRNSAAYKGIYALIAKQGAIDWYYTEKPFSTSQFEEQGVDVRQIFPKAWLAKNYPQENRGSSIVNKTLLSYRAGRSVSGPPRGFMATLARESGTKPEWFDDIVATHLIDPDTLHTDDFAAFYADRARQLLELVHTAMGKRTVARDIEEGSR